MTTKMPSSSLAPLDALTRLVKTLRGGKGCPWDRQQTPRSISIYLTEEVYELVDAIESADPDRVCEELGDVLFHIFFIARLYEEMGHFDINSAARMNTEKMIRRHPHVFGEDRLDTTEQIRKQWHEIKKREKNQHPNESVLDTIPLQLPALMRAYRVSERAARSGFDWPDISGVINKVKEECDEFIQAAGGENQRQNEDEFGDILFTLVNVARFARIHPETALTGSIKKFEMRFKEMERRIKISGREMNDLSQAELDELWDKIKEREG